jgi:phosphoglycolate phosphatase-like HAD superfamily hydrolase
MSRLLFRILNRPRSSICPPSFHRTYTLPKHTFSKMSTQNLSGPIHFVLDWDGTITKKDTLDALVTIAADAKPNFPTQERWKSVVDAYLSDYTSTLDRLAQNGKLPTTLEAEKKLLQDLKRVEQRSLDRILQSRIFKDLTREQLFHGANLAISNGSVSLRPGAQHFIRSIRDSNPHALHILSVNWSRTFISRCLEYSGAEIPKNFILANELGGLDAGRPATGGIGERGDIKIISSGDKARYLEMMREARQAEGVLTGNGVKSVDVGDSRKLGPLVYVGDSWTDIECLLAANVGICMRDEPMGSSQGKLAEALGRLGVECPHLKDLSEDAKGQIVWARDFVEIQKWVDRHGL